MQNFHNGQLPTNRDEPARTADEYDDDMIQELANKLSALVRRGGGGLRMNFDELSYVLGDDLATHVFKRAGFHRMPETWAIGRGNGVPGDYTFYPAFARGLEEIVDDYS